MRLFSRFKKGLSTGLLFFFIASQGVFLPDGFALPMLLQPIQVSRGIIETRHEGSQGEVVILEDAHGYIDAQRSIRSILDQLENKYQFKHFLIEGATDPLESLLIESYPDSEKKNQYLTFELNRGSLNGAEVAALNKQQGTIYSGLEDKQYYEDNLKAYLEVKKSKLVQAAKDHLETEKLLLKEEKRQVYSQQLFDLEQNESLYQDRKNLFIWLMYLKQFSEFGTYKELNALKVWFENQKKISKDAQFLIIGLEKRLQDIDLTHAEKIQWGSLKQEWSNELINERQYVQGMKEILGSNRLTEEEKSLMTQLPQLNIQILTDLETLVSRIKARLAKSPEEKTLLEKSHNLKLKEAALNLKLTRNQWQELQQLGIDLPQVINNYYLLAIQREKNFLKEITEQLKQGQKKVVVHVGGFHTEGLINPLLKQNLTLRVIKPRFELQAKSEAYDKRIDQAAFYFSTLKEPSRLGTPLLRTQIEASFLARMLEKVPPQEWGFSLIQRSSQGGVVNSSELLAFVAEIINWSKVEEMQRELGEFQKENLKEEGLVEARSLGANEAYRSSNLPWKEKEYAFSGLPQSLGLSWGDLENSYPTLVKILVRKRNAMEAFISYAANVKGQRNLGRIEDLFEAIAQLRDIEYVGVTFEALKDLAEVESSGAGYSDVVLDEELLKRIVEVNGMYASEALGALRVMGESIQGGWGSEAVFDKELWYKIIEVNEGYVEKASDYAQSLKNKVQAGSLSKTKYKELFLEFLNHGKENIARTFRVLPLLRGADFDVEFLKEIVAHMKEKTVDVFGKIIVLGEGVPEGELRKEEILEIVRRAEDIGVDQVLLQLDKLKEEWISETLDDAQPLESSEEEEKWLDLVKVEAQSLGAEEVYEEFFLEEKVGLSWEELESDYEDLVEVLNEEEMAMEAFAAFTENMEDERELDKIESLFSSIFQKKRVISRAAFSSLEQLFLAVANDEIKKELIDLEFLESISSASVKYPYLVFDGLSLLAKKITSGKVPEKLWDTNLLFTATISGESQVSTIMNSLSEIGEGVISGTIAEEVLRVEFLVTLIEAYKTHAAVLLGAIRNLGILIQRDAIDKEIFSEYFFRKLSGYIDDISISDFSGAIYRMMLEGGGKELFNLEFLLEIMEIAKKSTVNIYRKIWKVRNNIQVGELKKSQILEVVRRIDDIGEENVLSQLKKLIAEWKREAEEVSPPSKNTEEEEWLDRAEVEAKSLGAENWHDVLLNLNISEKEFRDLFPDLLAVVASHPYLLDIFLTEINQFDPPYKNFVMKFFDGMLGTIIYISNFLGVLFGIERMKKESKFVEVFKKNMNLKILKTISRTRKINEKDIREIEIIFQIIVSLEKALRLDLRDHARNTFDSIKEINIGITEGVISEEVLDIESLKRIVLTSGDKSLLTFAMGALRALAAGVRAGKISEELLRVEFFETIAKTAGSEDMWNVFRSLVSLASGVTEGKINEEMMNVDLLKLISKGSQSQTSSLFILLGGLGSQIEFDKRSKELLNVELLKGIAKVSGSNIVLAYKSLESLVREFREGLVGPEMFNMELFEIISKSSGIWTESAFNSFHNLVLKGTRSGVVKYEVLKILAESSGKEMWQAFDALAELGAAVTSGQVNEEVLDVELLKIVAKKWRVYRALKGLGKDVLDIEVLKRIAEIDGGTIVGDSAASGFHKLRDLIVWEKEGRVSKEVLDVELLKRIIKASGPSTWDALPALGFLGAGVKTGKIKRELLSAELFEAMSKSSGSEMWAPLRTLKELAAGVIAGNVEQEILDVEFFERISTLSGEGLTQTFKVLSEIGADVRLGQANRESLNVKFLITVAEQMKGKTAEAFAVIKGLAKTTPDGPFRKNEILDVVKKTDQIGIDEVLNQLDQLKDVWERSSEEERAPPEKEQEDEWLDRAEVEAKSLGAKDWGKVWVELNLGKKELHNLYPELFLTLNSRPFAIKVFLEMMNRDSVQTKNKISKIVGNWFVI